MVFAQVQPDWIEIDGVTYELTNAVKMDHFDCKEKFLYIIMHIEQGYDDDFLTQDTLAAWKKELISKLKDFEKRYVKHAKSTNPFLADLQRKAMQPVTDLTEASYNLANFRRLSVNKEFPEFRKKALTEKFILHLTDVCRILKAFPNEEKKTLDEEYDIKHILDILYEIEGWKDIPPFRFYFDPFQKAYDDLVEELQ